jgi:hypothetical protein
MQVCQRLQAWVHEACHCLQLPVHHGRLVLQCLKQVTTRRKLLQEAAAEDLQAWSVFAA